MSNTADYLNGIGKSSGRYSNIVSVVKSKMYRKLKENGTKISTCTRDVEEEIEQEIKVKIIKRTKKCCKGKHKLSSYLCIPKCVYCGCDLSE